MQICVVFVLVNDDQDKKVHFSTSVDKIQDIEDLVPNEAMQADEGAYYYLWLRKGKLELHEYWSIVGNASRYDENFELTSQYGVWACFYEDYPPTFKEPSPLIKENKIKYKLDFDTSQENLSDFCNVSKRKTSVDRDKSFSILDKHYYKSGHGYKNVIELFPKKRLQRCDVDLILVSEGLDEKSKLFNGCCVINYDDIDEYYYIYSDCY